LGFDPHHLLRLELDYFHGPLGGLAETGSASFDDRAHTDWLLGRCFEFEAGVPSWVIFDVMDRIEVPYR
jgi:hypothetical protein